MKIWINFEEKDIKKRKDGWSEGDDFKGQLVYEKEQDINNCSIRFNEFSKVILNFDIGFIQMTKREFGELFR